MANRLVFILNIHTAQGVLHDELPVGFCVFFRVGNHGADVTALGFVEAVLFVERGEGRVDGRPEGAVFAEALEVGEVLGAEGLGDDCYGLFAGDRAAGEEEDVDEVVLGVGGERNELRRFRFDGGVRIFVVVVFRICL